MDKVITSHTQKIGSDGDYAVKLGIKGKKLRIEGSIAYEKDVEEIVSPVLKKVDELVDFVEKKIPGDQVAEAQRLKAEIHELLISKLIGSVPEQALVEAPKAE